MPLRSTSDDRAKIIEMHEAHMPVPEIAKVTGFGESTIYNIIAKERERRLKAEGDLLARSISVDRIIDEREGKKAAADMEQMIADYHAQNRPTKPAAPSAPEAEQTAPEAEQTAPKAEQPQENPPEIAPAAEQPPETVSAPAPEPEPAAEPEPAPEPVKCHALKIGYETETIYLVHDLAEGKIAIEFYTDSASEMIVLKTTDALEDMRKLARDLIHIYGAMRDVKGGGGDE